MALEQKIDIWFKLDPKLNLSRVSLPEVYGIGKGSDPHIRSEKQKPIKSID